MKYCPVEQVPSLMYGPAMQPEEQVLVALHHPQWFILSTMHDEQSVCAVHAGWSGHVSKNQLLQYKPGEHGPVAGPAASPCTHVLVNLHHPHPALLLHSEHDVCSEQSEAAPQCGGRRGLAAVK